MYRTIKKKDLLSLSLAIFCLLFGAGNLIYPLAVGRSAGSLAFFGMIGFFITALVLPLMGLVGMILFEGNYNSFFYRLGKQCGAAVIFICMITIGPVVVIPRCVTLSYTMVEPFLPFVSHCTEWWSMFLFSIIFLCLAFCLSWRKTKIVAILGNGIAPALLASMILIVVRGMMQAHTAMVPRVAGYDIFKTGFMMGYQTLDLLGTIFFASVIVTMLKKSSTSVSSMTALARQGLFAGIIGLSLLGCVYVGMCFLGAFHSHGFIHADPGQLLRLIALHLLQTQGAFIIGLTVFLACLSTVIGLAPVVAEYVQTTVSRNALSYTASLIITLLCSLPLSVAGLSSVLAIAGGPIVYILYPLLITLTACNIAYKLYGFSYVKMPVTVATGIATAYYLYM